MNMDCAQHQQSFSALIDQQLDSLKQGALEEHLCNCPDCSNKFAEQKAIGQRLSEYFKALNGVPDLWTGLKEKLPPTCELILLELSAFLDGELTSAAQEGVRVHLNDCQECIQYFRKLNTTNRLIVKALEFPEKSQLDLWPALRAQLNANCTLIKSELSAFIDQEMPMQRHRDITVHILECPTCSEAVRRFSGLGELIAKSYTPDAADTLNILSGVKSNIKVVPFTPREKPKSKAKLVYISAAVVTIGLLVGAFGLMAMVIGGEASLESAEAYLIRSEFRRPYDSAEAVVYGE